MRRLHARPNLRQPPHRTAAPWSSGHFHRCCARRRLHRSSGSWVCPVAAHREQNQRRHSRDTRLAAVAPTRACHFHGENRISPRARTVFSTKERYKNDVATTNGLPLLPSTAPPQPPLLAEILQPR